MSKFAKPKPVVPSEEEIARVIGGADADDGRSAPAPEPVAEVRFTMTLPVDMAEEIDQARRRLGQTRLGWLRLAAAEKLGRGV
jgi:hypothetical protein